MAMRAIQIPRKLSFFLVTVLSVGLLCILVGLFNPDTVRTPPDNALYTDPNQPIEARVADLLSYMTLEEKIGQMALVEKNSLLELEDIREYHLGAILSGSGAKPEENTVLGWKHMIDSFQVQARSSRLGIPLLYGSDAIHGHAHVLEATVFPHAIGLGAAHNPDLVKEIASVTREELAATGVNWNFAPNLDQPRDIRWGRVYESFSDDPELVSQLGTAYVEGLQGNWDKNEQRVLATLKHYIGVGSMGWNTSQNNNFKLDQGITEPDEQLLYAQYLPPFKEAIDAGALSVMVGLNSWGDQKMVLQKRLLNDVLKEELAFQGFVVSDWYGVHEGRKDIFWATVSSVNAGVDMLMLPYDYKTFIKHLTWANRLGLVSDERINEAVGRILYAKFSLGLFDEDRGAVSADRSLGTVESRALAREAVAQSLVLLKNNAVLPLDTHARRIRVAGSAADNVGQQMGAWSLEWQGVDGNWPAGTVSILEGIREHVGSGTVVEYDPLGDFSEVALADVGIAVVGEKPYAEGWGDTEYPILSQEDLVAIKNLQANSEKVVVILISGRPLLIENEIDEWDALVAAWLPGSEGGGVADVLFGVKPFTGTLPVPWPRRSEQLPIGLDESTADGTPVLFPRYYGLKL